MAMTAVVKAVTATTAVLPESPVTVVVTVTTGLTVGVWIAAAKGTLLVLAAATIAAARVVGFATAFDDANAVAGLA